MATALDDPKAVVLRCNDTVAVAARPIPRGCTLQLAGRTIEVREPIGLGHKVALDRYQSGRAGAQVWTDHRLCIEVNTRRLAGTRT